MQAWPAPRMKTAWNGIFVGIQGNVEFPSFLGDTEFELYNSSNTQKGAYDCV